VARAELHRRQAECEQADVRLEEMIRDGSVPATAATLPPPSTPRPSPEVISAVFVRHGHVNVGPGQDD
jgi:hypothetical protein